MSKFITDEILGEREKRILGSFVSLVNPTSRSQSVEKNQIILKDNKYYSVIKSGTVDFSTSVPNAEYLKPLNLKSGGGGFEIEELKKKTFLKHGTNDNHYWDDIFIKNFDYTETTNLDFFKQFNKTDNMKLFLEKVIHENDYKNYIVGTEVIGDTFVYKEFTEMGGTAFKFLQDGVYIITRWYGRYIFPLFELENWASTLYNNPPNCSNNRIIIFTPNYHWTGANDKYSWVDECTIELSYILVKNGKAQFLGEDKHIKENFLVCTPEDYSPIESRFLEINYKIKEEQRYVLVNSEIPKERLSKIFKDNFFKLTPRAYYEPLIQIQVIKLKGVE